MCYRVQKTSGTMKCTAVVKGIFSCGASPIPSDTVISVVRRSKPATPGVRLTMPIGESPAKQLAGFIANYDPSVAKLARQCRSTLRKRLPTAIEQVYDNYQFLAIGYCTTERTSDCICSLAVSPKGVSLSFYYGASLEDPDGVLQGTGKQNRFVRLETARTLENPSVEQLIAAAIANAKTPLPTDRRGYLMIKPVSAKQRPRRPTNDRRTQR